LWAQQCLDRAALVGTFVHGLYRVAALAWDA